MICIAETPFGPIDTPKTVAAMNTESLLSLTSRGDLSTLLVEQHVGFALAAASRYYVMEAGRITSDGTGGVDAHEHVRAAMAI